jgi:hypothetical protein
VARALVLRCVAVARTLAHTHAALALRVLLRSLADGCGRAQELETLRRQNAALAEQIRAVRACHTRRRPPPSVAHSPHWRFAAQARARNEALDKLTEQTTLEGKQRTRSAQHAQHTQRALSCIPASLATLLIARCAASHFSPRASVLRATVAEFSAAHATVGRESAAVLAAVDAMGERAAVEVEGVLVQRAASVLDRAAAVSKSVLGGGGGGDGAQGEAAGGGSGSR